MYPNIPYFKKYFNMQRIVNKAKSLITSDLKLSFCTLRNLPPDLQTIGVISSNGWSMLNIVGKGSLKKNEML